MEPYSADDIKRRRKKIEAFEYEKTMEERMKEDSEKTKQRIEEIEKDALRLERENQRLKEVWEKSKSERNGR